MKVTVDSMGDILSYRDRMMRARNDYLEQRKEMTRPTMEEHARIYPEGLSAGYLKDMPRTES